MPIRSMYEDVSEFHQQILKNPHPETPTLNSELWMIERYRFLLEEAEEFFESAEQGNIVKATDGLVDLIYVALGTLYMMGVPMQQCWDAVHKANMTKISGTTKRGMRIDAMKPEGWVGPEKDIAAAILEVLNAPKSA